MARWERPVQRRRLVTDTETSTRDETEIRKPETSNG
jgi:hypothetical protein